MDAILEAIESKTSAVYGTTTAAVALTGGKVMESGEAGEPVLF